MPIYEYQCQSCGNQVEVLQKISDDPLKDCASCGEPEMKKQISAAAFRLSGSGWYETDFKSGNKKNLSGNDKTDSKPADKAPKKAAASGCSDGSCSANNTKT